MFGLTSLPLTAIAFMATVLPLVAFGYDLHLHLLGMVIALIAVVYGFRVHPSIGALTSLASSLVLSFVFVSGTRAVIIAVFLQALLVAYTNYGWWSFWLCLTGYRLWLHGSVVTLWTFPEFCIFSFIKMKLARSYADERERHPSPRWSSLIFPSDMELECLTPLIHANDVFVHSILPVLVNTFLRVSHLVLDKFAQVGKLIIWHCFPYWISGARHHAWRPAWKVAQDERDLAERLAQKVPLRRIEDQKEARQENWIRPSAGFERLDCQARQRDQRIKSALASDNSQA
ncbi:hypothetical protein F4861DRAFT_435334 [Xylaria intraflava]|nr:hypothetical protein F4861DRAFT_435334 [Xylaria intraflava]